MIKHGILALLTQGSAYGLQVRNELTERAEKPIPFNVGQIYSTIDRLLAAGLLNSNERTTDGLPLYSLTEDGKLAAQQWIRSAAPWPRGRWETMLFQVLVVRSLPGIDCTELIVSYTEYWRKTEHDLLSQSTLMGSAAKLQAEAALKWLSEVSLLPPTAQPLSSVRPPRGRPARNVNSKR